MRIKVMSVLVGDQAKAPRCYTEVLDSVKKKRIPLGEHAGHPLVQGPPTDWARSEPCGPSVVAG